MTAGDIVAAFNATLLVMASGEIAPDEALTMTRVLDGRFTAPKAWEIERYLTWGRGEIIPGDDLFAPADDEEDEEDEAEAERLVAPPGPSTGASGAAQDEGSPASATDSPHHQPPASADKSKDPGPEQAAAASADDLHSARIEQVPGSEAAVRLHAQRKLFQHFGMPGFDPDACVEAEVAVALSAAPR
jgi:hypothetical protein